MRVPASTGPTGTLFTVPGYLQFVQGAQVQQLHGAQAHSVQVQQPEHAAADFTDVVSGVAATATIAKARSRIVFILSLHKRVLSVTSPATTAAGEPMRKTYTSLGGGVGGRSERVGPPKSTAKSPAAGGVNNNSTPAAAKSRSECGALLQRLWLHGAAQPGQAR